MSEEARAELARNLAGRRDVLPDESGRRSVTSYTATHGIADDPEAAAEAVRIAADLQRTERRMYRLERSMSRSRYQMGDGSGSPTGRYARLQRRADRLERKLRRLR